uniref:Uncharacterized protein n=1 Tax=Astyanax mexicanus TaxID=7994 RepID=A0A8B9LKZ7_ASTMX
SMIQPTPGQHRSTNTITEPTSPVLTKVMHWIWNTTANHTHSHFTLFYKILPKCLESTFSSHLHLHNLPLIQEIQ